MGKAVVLRWNADKKHRSPCCHVIPHVGEISSFRRYECCRCGRQFTRWPRLGWLWPLRWCEDPHCPYHSYDAGVWADQC